MVFCHPVIPHLRNKGIMWTDSKLILFHCDDKKMFKEGIFHRIVCLKPPVLTEYTAYILLRQLFIPTVHSLNITNKKQKPVVRMHERTDSDLPALLPSSDALYRTEFSNRRPAA